MYVLKTHYLFVFVFAFIHIFVDVSFQCGDRLHSVFNSTDLSVTECEDQT